ncbi:MAG: hypothetical protein KC547_08815 [Anaerolineae bacterium]|nr:hypothetical protein [Anaerolineae bacterium]MCA9910407.1 hypothetical protein [Anaerolineae bacterium]
MTRKHIIISLLVLVTIFAVGALVASAQGNGNGNGPGPVNPVAPGDCTDGCDPQMPNDGTGMMYGRNGARGNNQERGNMRSNRGQGTGGLYPTLPPTTDVELTDDVIAAMTAGLMDEYHAYAVYDSVIAQFGAIAPFVNIQQSEAQHIAAWEYLFDRYGLVVPAAPDFAVPTFASLTDACQAAADAEIANFDLYDQMMVTLADYPDMVQVVTALRNASEFQHLPAFEQCAAR